MRKYFIDNIRWMAIMMLFPYHTFMIYNSFGENFYVKGEGISATTGFIVATSPWFMPLLFAVAGISSYYALQKRTTKEFVKERFLKLLIPLFSGILLIVPVQTYFAERFHNGYDGGYFEQYVLFFTKQTDLTGNTGGFTPAHLWFILYLFVISIAAIPVILKYQKLNKKPKIDQLPLIIILLMFVFPGIMMPMLNIGGKSLGEFFTYFMLGYFVLSNEEILKKLDKYRFYLLAIILIYMGIIALAWKFLGNDIFKISYIYIFFKMYGWTMILLILGLGRNYLNFRNNITAYLSDAAFPIYLFHQTWLVTVAYYILLDTSNIGLQMIFIVAISFFLTYATYEICKRIPLARFLFGIKYNIK